MVQKDRNRDYCSGSIASRLGFYNVQKEFSEVVQLSGTVVEQEQTVRRAISEQNEGGKQLLQAVGSMRELTQTVKERTEKLLTDTNAIKESILELGK